MDDDTDSSELLEVLRQKKIPCEVTLRDNKYDSKPDSSFIFTNSDFKYALLKINNLDKVCLEYYKENNLNHRACVTKEMNNSVRAIADKYRIDNKTNYVIEVTDGSYEFLYLEFRNSELVSAENIIFLE